MIWDLSVFVSVCVCGGQCVSHSSCCHSCLYFWFKQPPLCWPLTSAITAVCCPETMFTWGGRVSSVWSPLLSDRAVTKTVEWEAHRWGASAYSASSLESLLCNKKGADLFWCTVWPAAPPRLSFSCTVTAINSGGWRGPTHSGVKRRVQCARRRLKLGFRLHAELEAVLFCMVEDDVTVCRITLQVTCVLTWKQFLHFLSKEKILFVISGIHQCSQV